MKVKIGPYKDWVGPYQLAEKLCFWTKEGKLPDIVADRLGIWGDRPHTWLYKFLSWIHSKQERTIKVKIDRWDTWSMDHTLAPIILPMLVQLKETKHGAPMVDMKDVPKELRPSKKEIDAYNKDGTTDENFFVRWDWVMDEMIYAFDCKANKDDVFMCFDDRDEQEKEQDRISNGFRLFGKYYENLWD
jgi:hypothetical protein